jgi:hypothetical protein
MLHSGQTQWLAPRAIHDVRNPFQEPAVSVHAYSPPLSAMTFYAWRRDRLTPTRTVRSGAPEPEEFAS